MAAGIQRLAGKVALVTGSTTGIGEAFATKLAEEGASVMVHGRRSVEAEYVVSKLKGFGVDASYLLGDLSDPAFDQALVDATVGRFGKIDILINNAALTTRSNLDSTDAAFFDRILAVNTRAPLLLIKAAVPYFKKAGGGSVLNIGSVNGYCGERNLLAYSMSKGALMTLSRNLADALGTQNIRVNHFNVGWVLTENEKALKISEGFPENWGELVDRTSAPSGRLIAPFEIAEFAITFLDPKSGPISGAVVELEQYPIIGRNPSKDTV